MNKFDFIQFILFIFFLCLFTRPLGQFMANVFKGEKHILSTPFGWLERLTYKLGGIDSNREMSWKEYAWSLMAFNIFGIIFLFIFQMIQAHLPLNPANMPNVSWHSAINTAVSFVTNTNWQGYAGETTMSYLTQMLTLSVQNFVSAAVGLTVAIALARGIANRLKPTIGNFWADLIRGTVYILLPLAIILAIVFVAEGVVQTFSAYQTVTTLEGAKQTVSLGPVASQEAIKMLGTNGGGFFNANSAHPFENPTPFVNFLQMLAIFLIPAALTHTFGILTEAKKHGWIIFATMMIMFVTLTSLSLWSEYTSNPIFGHAALMEGKETRFGIFNSVFFSSVTTSASCGAVNAMHSSLTPLSGAVAMFNMMVGEVIFGGVGAGMYGMLLFILLTVFLSGLMVGRSPEYLGKKIEAREVTLVILAVLAPCATILLFSAISASIPQGLSSLAHKGPHGFSEILYAFTSAAANNGSAFAGLNSNTPYYNIMLAIAMFIGRFAIIIPLLGVAGSLSAKKYSPPSPGTFEVDTFLFSILLIGVILIVGALTFVPSLMLGPIVEHFIMLKGIVF